MQKALWLTSKHFKYLWLSDELFEQLCQATFIRLMNGIWTIRPYDENQRTLDIYIPKNRPFRAEDFTVELENGERKCILA